MGAFEDALGDFVKNFAYGNSVSHLINRGYSVERIMKEYDYPLSREELEKMVEQKKRRDEAERKASKKE